MLVVIGQLATIADMASIITGLTTIALVMVTYAAVRSGRASAEAAAASAELAERQLREAHRPVLIPMGDPHDQGPDLMIAVRNIGAGPALRVYGRVQAVVVFWAEFPEQHVEHDRCVYIHGSGLTAWLLEQKAKLTGRQAEQVTAAVTALGREASSQGTA